MGGTGLNPGRAAAFLGRDGRSPPRGRGAQPCRCGPQRRRHGSDQQLVTQRHPRALGVDGEAVGGRRLRGETPSGGE